MEGYLDKIKEGHSKFAIFIWLAYGAYALIFGKLHGLGTFLIYFIAGLLVASFASMLTYLLQQLIVKMLVKTHASDSFTAVTSYILLVINSIWIILVANIFLSVINNI